MRTDPSDTGGLFIGRRPGTAPLRYRTPPQRRGRGRRRLDAAFAAVILAVMVVVGASFWGPIPLAWLWVASQIEYHAGSVSAGLAVGFLGMLLTLLGGLMVLRVLDDLWVVVRRAAGHDQREGVLVRIFAVSAVIGGVLFVAWWLLIGGLGPTLAPR